ncbi:MAG: lysylphosphatidylglycerol synthase domain-containing protein, partial [Ignavibacteria bacterium]
MTKILFSGIILAYLFNIVPIKEILGSILNTDLYLFIAGFLSAVPINYLSALETQYLTRIQGLNLSVLEILKIHLATSFYGLFLPGVLSGGAVKWYKFAKFGSKSSAAAVVVLNRFLEILMIVFLGIIFSFPAFYSSGNQKLLIVLVMILFFMICLYLLLLSKSGLNFILKILLIFPFPHFIKDIVKKFADAMLQFQNLSLKD